MLVTRAHRGGVRFLPLIPSRVGRIAPDLGLNRVSGTHGSSEFNVRPDPPRITARRFIKTVKQKKRFRLSVLAVWVFAVKASGETRGGARRSVGGRNGGGAEGGARLCLTLVTMGHFLGQAPAGLHVGLVPVS